MGSKLVKAAKAGHAAKVAAKRTGAGPVTGYDPDLNKTYNIFAQGANKEYHRTKLGPSFDIAKLIQNATGADAKGDNFTVDLYFARTTGTVPYFKL